MVLRSALDVLLTQAGYDELPPFASQSVEQELAQLEEWVTAFDRATAGVVEDARRDTSRRSRGGAHGMKGGAFVCQVPHAEKLERFETRLRGNQVTANFAGNSLADFLTESRIMGGNLVRVARRAVGLLPLVIIGTGAGVLLLVLVPIVWMRALLGFDPLLKEEDMAWFE